jgi:hypothetical protein
MRRQAFTLVEMLVTLGVMVFLTFIAVLVGKGVWERSAVAVSAANLRSLAAGAQSYLAENNRQFWPYRENVVAGQYGVPGTGVRWWWGFESTASLNAGEGRRDFDASLGPLGAYVPKGTRPDLGFAVRAAAFKPKYRHGYIGIGYNVLLGGSGFNPPSKTRPQPAMSYWQLSNPARVVVFTTSAQVNTFQAPASTSKPMIEEFYGIDHRERTVRFLYGDTALVAFADGSCGFLPIDESTRDTRMKEANIGRFAPVGSTKHLK